MQDTTAIVSFGFTSGKIVVLADFLPFRIPLRRPYSSTFIRSKMLHRVLKSPESLVTKHVWQGVPEVTYDLFAFRTLQQMLRGVFLVPRDKSS